jgi:hypothetical protein
LPTNGVFPDGLGAAPKRDPGAGREPDPMRLTGVDITSQIQLHSLRAGHAASCCSACERHLLPGELLHVYESGRSLCTLCRGRLPEDQRSPLRSERIHAAAVRLAVVSRAA